MIARIQDAGEWGAAGHGSWLTSAGPWTAAAGLALLAGFVLVALVRGRRYRALDVLADADREAVSAAITTAERRTRGEIVCVVVERADRHPGAQWLAALVTLLLGSALLAGWLPWGSPAWLLLCQSGLAALGWVAARALPDFKRRFVSERRASEVAEEQAVQEFQRTGIAETEGDTGVLIFVTLLERRVVVLGDAAIDAQVGSERWGAVDAAVLEGVRGGDLAGGLARAVEMCGDVLAEHFPWTAADRDELPNHLIVRHE